MLQRSSRKEEVIDSRAPHPPGRRSRTVWRWILAGPVAIVVALLTLMGMPLYFPPGAGNVDNLILPLVLLPVVWSALFFHAILDRSLARVAVVTGSLAALNIAFIVIQILG
jgi:hypothetical protein